MVQRIQWEDRYAIGIAAGVIGAQLNMTDAVDSTAGETKAGIILNNHPHLDPAPNIIDTEKVTGSAARVDGAGREFNQGTKEPTFSLDFDAIAKVLYAPLHLFAQKGNLESTNVKWFFPYSYESVPAAPEVFGNLVRSLAPAGTAESHRAIGMICNSISFNSEVGAALSITAEMMAQDVELNYNVSAANDNFRFTNDANLLWQNAVVQISDGSVLAPVDIDVDGFSLTLTNSPIRKMYNNQLTQKYLMGKIVGEGSIKIPWSPGQSAWDDNTLLANFVSGTPTRFSIYWGSRLVTGANELSLNFIARYTGAPIGQDEDEIVTDLSFQIVERVFFDTLVDGIANITSFTEVAQVVTPTYSGAVGDGNIYPGDYIVFPDATDSQVKHLVIDVDANTQTIGASPTGGPSEMYVINQPFNIGLNDGLDRALMS